MGLWKKAKNLLVIIYGSSHKIIIPFFFVVLTLPTTLWASNPLVDLKRSIQTSESAVKDLKLGTEAQVLFFHEKQPQRTRYSIIYLHGFSASPQEVSPLPQLLAKTLKANLYLHRYKGHGIQGRDGLKNVTHYDWIRETHRAFEIGRILGDEVIVLATSTGASLATIETLNNPRFIKALLFISPNFGLKNPYSKLLLWPGGRWIAQLFLGTYREWKALSKEQEYFWTTKYPSEVLVEVMRVVDFSNTLSATGFEIPVFIARNHKDPVVDPNLIDDFFYKKNSYPNKQLCCEQLPSENDHVLAGSILSPSGTPFLHRKMVAFLRKYIKL